MFWKQNQITKSLFFEKLREINLQDIISCPRTFFCFDYNVRNYITIKLHNYLGISDKIETHFNLFKKKRHGY